MSISEKLGEGGAGLSKAHPLPDGDYLKLILARIETAAAALPSGAYTCLSGDAVGDWMYISASNTAAKADADDTAKQPVIGVIVSKPTTTSCLVQGSIEIAGLSGLTAGTKYYLSATAGGLTSSAPASHAVPLGVAKNTTTLVIPIAAFGMGAATIRGALDVTGAIVGASTARATAVGVGAAPLATGINSAGPVVIPTFTIATLPNAATYARGLIWISDQSGGATFAISNGTNWKILTLGATAS